MYGVEEIIQKIFLQLYILLQIIHYSSHKTIQAMENIVLSLLVMIRSLNGLELELSLQKQFLQ